MDKLRLKILVVEDLQDDAELMIRQLRQDGLEAEWSRVDEEAAFLRGLDSGPDVILADYSLPRFSGQRVLELLAERGHPIPVILVSGTVGEETAAEAIKSGAFDYVLKGKLTRLAASVRNALQEKHLREEAFEAEAALRASESRFRKLIENAPDAYALLDTSGRLLYASPSTQRLLGFDPEQIVGAEPAQSTHRDDLPALLERLQELIDKPDHVATVKYRFRHQDGSWRWLESTMTNQLAEPSIGAMLFNFRDITDRVRAEEELRKAEEKYRKLVEQLPVITYLDILHDNMPQGQFYSAYVSPQVEKLLGYSPEDFYAEPSLWMRLIDPLHRERVTAQHAVHLTMKQPYSDEYPMSARDGRRVWVRDEAVVVLGEDGRHFSQGIVIDITERKRREMELEAITAVSAALRKAATGAEMVPIILDQLIELLKVEAAALVMHEAGSGDTIFDLARGSWARGTGRRLPAGEGISGQVIATGTAYRNNDVESDPRFIPPIAGAHLKAAACVPLKAQEQTIGALWIASNNPIEAAEMQLLTAISNIAASAIQRATLFEQTQRRLQQISALHSIDIAISSSFDLRFTLSILLEQVSSHLGVDATDVLLLNPNTQMLEYVAGRGFMSVALERLRFRLGDGLAGQAALERRIVSIPNLQEHEGRMARRELLAAERFVSYHGMPLIAKGQIKGVLEIFHRSPLNPDPEWLDFLETLAEQAAIAINDATMFDSLQRSNTELILAYDATIEGWSRALDLRDNETEGHTQRVTAATLRLARTMAFTENELIQIRRGALLHDIGKMGIPDAILLKPGQLTDDEWVVMRKHPQYAYDLIRPIEFLLPAIDIPYCHHEKWDGTGYPRGLKGEHIPLAARIFSLADVWDALRSDRPYRQAWTADRALEYIRSERGKHFDPAMVDVFLSMDDLED